MAGYAGNSLQTALLNSIFCSKAVNGSSGIVVTGTATGLWVALHSADPVASGNQATNEANYTAYARILVDRTTTVTGWSVTGNSPATANPYTAITFPASTGGSSSMVATNFSVGSSSSGAGILYYSGPVTQNITITGGVTPSLTTASAITQD